MKGKIEINKLLLEKLSKDFDGNQILNFMSSNLNNKNENKQVQNNSQTIPMPVPVCPTPMGNQNLYYNQNQMYGGFQNQAPLNYNPQYGSQPNMGIYNSQNLNVNYLPNTGMYTNLPYNMNFMPTMGMYNYQNPPQYNLQNSQNMNNSFQNMQQSAPNVPVPLN